MTDRNAETHHPVSRWRDLHDHNIRWKRTIARDHPHDVTKTQGEEIDTSIGKHAAQLRADLPCGVAKVLAQAGTQEPAVTELEAGVQVEIAEPPPLLLQRLVHGYRLYGPVRQDHPRPVGDCPHRRPWGDDFHPYSGRPTAQPGLESIL